MMQQLVKICFWLMIYLLPVVVVKGNSFTPKLEILKQKTSFNHEDFLEVGEYEIDSCFTISFWFKSSNLLSGITTLSNIGGKYWLRTTTNRELQLKRFDGGNITTEGLCISQNIWYQVVMVVNYPNVHIYLNGEKIISDRLKDSPLLEKCSIVLGGNEWREFFQGEMTGFNFYKKVLSKDQIDKIFNSEAEQAKLSTNVVAYLPMNNKKVGGEFQKQPEYEMLSFVYDEHRNKVAEFDSSTYIDLGAVAIDNVISIAGWVKPKVFDRQALVSSGHAFAFRLNWKGKLLFTIPQIIDVTSNSDIVNLNEWHHVAVSYHEENTVRFYLDGKFVEEVEVPEAQQASKKLRFGNNVWNDHFIGYMDDMVVWSRILTESEILALSKMSSLELKETMPPINANSKWFWLWSLPIIFLLGLLFWFLERNRNVEVEKESNNLSPFQKEAMGIIKENLSDSTFGVDKFARMMQLSRTSLYNRMKEELGKTPKEFIREERLIEAAHLIQYSPKSISEIIYLTGFESRAFFNKCFKTKFQMTPTEFRASKKDD